MGQPFALSSKHVSSIGIALEGFKYLASNTCSSIQEGRTKMKTYTITP